MDISVAFQPVIAYSYPADATPAERVAVDVAYFVDAPDSKTKRPLTPATLDQVIGIFTTSCHALGAEVLSADVGLSTWRTVLQGPAALALANGEGWACVLVLHDRRIGVASL